MQQDFDRELSAVVLLEKFPYKSVKRSVQHADSESLSEYDLFWLNYVRCEIISGSTRGVRFEGDKRR